MRQTGFASLVLGRRAEQKAEPQGHTCVFSLLYRKYTLLVRHGLRFAVPKVPSSRPGTWGNTGVACRLEEERRGVSCGLSVPPPQGTGLTSTRSFQCMGKFV